MAIGISTAYGRWRNEQKAAGRRPEDGVTALFVLGKRAESGGSAGGNGRRVGGLQRMTGGNVARGLVGSWARMGGQFNGWLNTMPATAGLCCAYCVRTASVRRRVDGRSGSARPRIGGNSWRSCDCSGRQRGSAQGFRGQFGKGNSGAGAFSVVRLRGEVSRRSGRFRWGSLYGKGGGVAEKRWGSRRKG